MATTISFTRTSPYSAAFTLSSDNGAPTAYPWASLNAGLADGPLKVLLAKLNAASALSTLNGGGSNSRLVRMRHIEGIAALQTTPGARTITWTANGLTVTATAGSTHQLEMRLADSPER
jgi:hypothetical protein